LATNARRKIRAASADFFRLFFRLFARVSLLDTPDFLSPRAPLDAAHFRRAFRRYFRRSIVGFPLRHAPFLGLAKIH
jgi:hypothetical protein